MSLKKLLAGVAGLTALILFSGCNFDSVSLPGPSQQAQVAAVCELSNISELIVCEALSAANVTMQDNCDNAELAAYSSEGAINPLYTAATSAHPVKCPTNVPTVGSCLLSDRTIYYYVVVWATAAAQTDCSNRSGVWQ
jgi:hypothetical protein